MTPPGITCPVCGMTSHHPTDIEEGYCGNCHEFTGDETRATTGEDVDRALTRLQREDRPEQ